MHAIAISFTVGILSRFSDLIVDDGLKVHRYAGYAASIAYGLLLALLLHFYPTLSPLVMAVAVAVTLSKKLDEMTHAIGIGSFLLFIAIFGLSPVDSALFMVFLAAGIIDEIGNDYMDKGKSGKALRAFFENRLTLEVAAFAVSVSTGNWIIWLSMLSFDIGYNVMARSKPFFKGRGLL